MLPCLIEARFLTLSNAATIDWVFPSGSTLRFFRASVAISSSFKFDATSAKAFD